MGPNTRGPLEALLLLTIRNAPAKHAGVDSHRNIGPVRMQDVGLGIPHKPKSWAGGNWGGGIGCVHSKHRFSVPYTHRILLLVPVGK